MNKNESWSPNSAERRDLAYHLHPYTDPSKLSDTGPHVIKSGDGIYITDNDNKKFIEAIDDRTNLFSYTHEFFIKNKFSNIL